MPASFDNGTGDFYSVKYEAIEALAIKINDLKLEGMELTFQPFTEHAG